jgi:TP901 family phage tail tape measure protein
MAINLGDAVLSFTADTGRLDSAVGRTRGKVNRATKEANRGLTGMAQKLRSIRGLAIVAGAAFLAWKVTSIFTNMIRAAGAFQRTMNRVRALTQATGRDFDLLRQKAADLGRTTQFTATQVGEGMAFLAQAGFSVNEIYASMEDTLNLAAAAQLDLATSADIVSNVMAGFGIQSSELGAAVDVLTQAFISSNTNLQQLGNAMKLGGPVAKAFGLTFEETAAALALMGNAGFQGTLAGTALRGALVRLGKDAKKFGLDIKDTSTGALKPFADLMDEVTRKGLDADEIMKLFGQRAGPAMLALLEQGSGALRLFTAELELSGGVTKRIADIQMEGLHGAIKRLQSAWEALQIALADTGFLDTITKAADAISKFVRAVALGVEEQERVLKVIGEINKEIEEKGFIAKWYAWARGEQQVAFEADQVVRSSLDMEAIFGRLNGQMNDMIRADAASEYRRQREELERLRAEELELERQRAIAAKLAAKRAKALGESFAAPFIKMRRAAEKAAEELEKERIKRSLQELNAEIDEMVTTLDLELSTEGIGAFTELTEEQLVALGERLKETGVSFTEMAQQAVDAFNQIAGSVQGTGGIMLRVMGLIVGQILRNIAMNQALAASTVATEAVKAGSIIKAIKEIAIVKSYFEFAEGYAALANQRYWKAAKHFAAAAFYGLVGALQVAAVAGAFGGGRGGGGAPGAGAGAAPVRGQVAGDTAEPLEVERRLQAGGIVSRPTLALLGEQAPAIKEAVIPFRTDRIGGVEPGEDAAPAVPIQIFIEGMIADDTLLDFVEKLSNAVKHGDIELQASDSFNVTQR